LRIFIQEPQVDSRTALADQLRSSLVQSIAMLRLLVDGWCEPPRNGAMHLSTLIQQVLSAIAQHGGARPDAAYRLLCGPGSPFTGVTPKQFAALLRSLGDREVLTQSTDGTLLLGPVGERTVNHYSFYTAFVTPEEYRLFAGGRPLGSVPVDFPLYPGVFLIFGGRRWRVISVDQEHRTVDLTPAAGGNPPQFLGGTADVHDRVRAEMRSILGSKDVLSFLSSTAAGLLAESRDAYMRYQLNEQSILKSGRDTILLPWIGSRASVTLAAQLSQSGLEAADDGIVITVFNAAPDEVRKHLRRLVADGPADPIQLAASVVNKATEKYDHWLDEELLAVEYACRSLDCAGAAKAAVNLLH
jgi:ATP-dependent Lhr-like helicase